MQYENIHQFTDVTYLQRGGSSYILTARNLYNNHKCILKLSIDNSRDDSLQNEGRILSNLDHKNIIKLLDMSKIHNRIYLVLELMEGQTLQDYVINNGPISYTQTLHIFQQICQGLNYLHQKNIIHRDLQPRNIFYCNDGSIKILDFGLSMIKNLDKNIKAQKNIKGIIDYISPKQILDSNIVEKWSDIYSLAAILYFLNTSQIMYKEKILNTKIRKKIYTNYDKTKIDNQNIIEQIDTAIRLYENKLDNMNDLMNLITTKQIIDKWKYVKS